MNVLVYQIDAFNDEKQLISSFMGGLAYKTQNLTFDFKNKKKLIDKVVNPRYIEKYQMTVSYVENDCADIIFTFETPEEYTKFVEQLRELKS